MLLFCCIAIVSVLLPGGYGLPGGPPIGGFRDRICNQLLPSHSGASPGNGNGGYFILSNLINNGGAYTAGQSYSRELQSHPRPHVDAGTACHVTACVKPQPSCSPFAAHTCTTVQLLGTANTFRGFLIQARDGANYIGSFTNLPARTQTLGCDTSNPAVSHMKYLQSSLSTAFTSIARYLS